MAPVAAAPIKLIRGLAGDVAIAVARPVLEGSTRLTDADLVAVAEQRGQAHLQAISRREAVSEAVSSVIVERGDDHTLQVLLGNDGATLSRAAHEAAVDRAGANPDLHEAVVNRRDLPVDLLNDMYFAVESKLRSRILERNGEGRSRDPGRRRSPRAATFAWRRRTGPCRRTMPTPSATSAPWCSARR